MLGHLGLQVPDLAAAKAYYDTLVPLLGFEQYLSHPDEFAYRPVGGRPGTYLFFYPTTTRTTYDPTRPGLQHLAFMVKTRGAVDAVHGCVVSLGGEVVHAPRAFPEYPQPYYATFWRDPFGFLLEAVCHYDRP